MHPVNGMGNSPSDGRRPTPGVVKQDKSSGGSVDTTKTRSDPQRVRMCEGKRPIGAARGKQSDTETPPPPLSTMATVGPAPWHCGGGAGCIRQARGAVQKGGGRAPSPQEGCGDEDCGISAGPRVQ